MQNTDIWYHGQWDYHAHKWISTDECKRRFMLIRKKWGLYWEKNGKEICLLKKRISLGTVSCRKMVSNRRDKFVGTTYKIPPRTTPSGSSSAAKPMVASWQRQSNLSLIGVKRNLKLETGILSFDTNLTLVTPFTKKGNGKCLQKLQGKVGELINLNNYIWLNYHRLQKYNL